MPATCRPIRFVKQYGAPRTGTNALRVLLRDSFPGLEVLMHVLGDKHSAPSRLVATATADWSRSPHELVLEAPARIPAATSDLADPAQRGEVERLAAPLVRAIRAGHLLTVVSIKDPYAWAASMLRSWVWPPDGPARLRAACERFNACYRSWLPLVERRAGLLVPYERLLDDPAGVVADCEARLGTRARPGATRALPQGVLLPAHWDHTPQHVHFEPFDVAYYRERRYLRELGAEGRGVVDATIDWSLLSGRAGPYSRQA
jgi:hypothetical protein